MNDQFKRKVLKTGLRNRTTIKVPLTDDEKREKAKALDAKAIRLFHLLSNARATGLNVAAAEKAYEAADAKARNFRKDAGLLFRS